MREPLGEVEMHRSLLGPAGVHPQALRELADGLARPLQKTVRAGRKQTPRGLMSSAVEGKAVGRLGPEAGDQRHHVQLEARNRR